MFRNPKDEFKTEMPAEWRNNWRAEEPNVESAPSKGWLLQQLRALIVEAEEKLKAFAEGRTDYVSYIRDFRERAQCCLADAGPPAQEELRELAAIDLGISDGLAQWHAKGVYSEVQVRDGDPSEFLRLQKEYDKQTPPKIVRMMVLMQQVRDKLLGISPTHVSPTEGAATWGPEPAGSPERVQGERASQMTPSQFRARQVGQVIRELDVLKPQLFVPSDYDSLREAHPEYLTFKAAELRGDLRTLLLNVQAHRRHIRLAQQIVGFLSSRTLETIKIDWNKHKPLDFRRRPTD